MHRVQTWIMAYKGIGGRSHVRGEDGCSEIEMEMHDMATESPEAEIPTNKEDCRQEEEEHHW